MTKIVYATPEESARAIKPDTRTEAQKILYRLQSEQTHDFEMGHEVDNAAIALKLIEQNLELIYALKKTRCELDACQSVIHLRGGFDPAYVEGSKEALKIADSILYSKSK